MRKQSMKTWLSAGALLVMPIAANAAGLGKLTVTSALGQPLRGEIELVAVQKDDVGLVSVRIAPMDAFREAKIERPSALSNMHFSVEKHPNGDPYVKVTSTTPVEEPFLDLLIELNWPAGRLMREYTVLLDPPGFAEKQAVAPVAMPITPAPLPATPSAPAAPAAKVLETTATAPAAPARKTVEKEPEKLAKEEKKTVALKATAETYGPVKSGETLAKIASQVKPEGVSLEQMLVGLYRDNPKAFTGNMNRMKTGQILRVPEAEKLAEITSKDAAREVKVQATDWHAYRQKLAAAVAESAPEKAETPPQTAVGKITPKVEDKAAKPAPSADVLKLSKGDAKEAKGLQDKIRALEEEATARGKTIKDANERIAQLEKSVKEMQRLVELKNQNLADLQKQAAKPQPPAPAAAKPALPEVKPAPVPEVKPAEQKPAAKMEAPAKPKPELAKPKHVVKPKPVAPPAEPAWYEGMLSNPFYLGGGVAAALLGGLLWLMMLGNRRRKNLTTFEDSIMTGGDLKANTVYGEASGGVVDTGDTSFLTDFSQAGLGNIDTNDVDPIAEAEVYMAYGRDAQAEEILKEAMVKDPNRHEIQLKLLEIYASRKNTNAFEAMASELYAAIGGQPNQVWEKTAEMGRQLDPGNPLYSAAVAGVMATAAAGLGEVAEPVVPEVSHIPEIEEVTEDLSPELAFGLDEEPVTAESMVEEPAMLAADEEGALDFDLDLGSMEAAEPLEELAKPGATTIEEDTELEGLSLDTGTIIPQVIEKAAQTAENTEAEMAPLDMDQALSFDLMDAAPVQADEMSQYVSDAELTQADEKAAFGSEQINLEAPPEFDMPVEMPQDFAPVASQEAPLDFDFQLDEEATEAPSLGSATAGVAMPDISLDMEKSAPMHAAASAEATTVAEQQGDSLWQEVSTKLDLAKAYVEMGDKEGAREILQEVMQEGDDKQQGDAKVLLAGIQ